MVNKPDEKKKYHLVRFDPVTWRESVSFLSSFFWRVKIISKKKTTYVYSYSTPQSNAKWWNSRWIKYRASIKTVWISDCCGGVVLFGDSSKFSYQRVWLWVDWAFSSMSCRQTRGVISFATSRSVRVKAKFSFRRVFFLLRHPPGPVTMVHDRISKPWSRLNARDVG